MKGEDESGSEDKDTDRVRMSGGVGMVLGRGDDDGATQLPHSYHTVTTQLPYIPLKAHIEHTIRLIEHHHTH